MRLLSRALVLLFPVLGLAQAPVLPANGVVNAADYTPNICPGMLISVFGGNFASALATADKLPLPNTMGGAVVELNDGVSSAWTALPLFFVSPSQINAQFPFAYDGKTVQLRVRNAAGTSAAASVAVRTAAPRLLTKTMNGRGEPLALDVTDYKLVAPALPARRNSYLAVYLTGLGAVTGNAVAGQPGGDGAAAPLNQVLAKVTATVGGKPAAVAWAGLAPGFAGLYQVNLQVASDVAVGLQPVVISANGIDSQDSVSMPVDFAVQAVARAVIGTAGGVVQEGVAAQPVKETPRRLADVTASGVQLTIPPGTLSQDTAITISKVVGADPVAQQASDSYVVRGLPAVLTKPIQLSLPTQGNLDPNSTLMVTKQLWGTGDVEQPTINGTQASITLPPAPAPIPDQTDSEIEAQVLRDYMRWDCDGGTFVMFIIPGGAGQSADICTWLNEADRKLTTIAGVVFKNARRTRWPMRVVYTSMDPDKWGEHVPGPNGDFNYDSLNLNYDKVKSAIAAKEDWQSELRSTAGHELFHYLQNLWDPRSPKAVAQTPAPDFWMEEAASTWFEGIMLDQPNYISYTVHDGGDWQFGFSRGLQFTTPAGCSTYYYHVAKSAAGFDDCKAVQNHGYGASLLLNYITRTTGRTQIVGDVVQAMIVPGYTTAAAALRDKVGGASSIANYWTTLARSLVESNYRSGETWPAPTGLLDVVKTSGVELIPSATTDARKDFSDAWNAQDLSMKLDRITFSEALPPGSSLRLAFDKSNSNVKAYLYRYQNQAFTFVTSFTDQYSLTNADQLVTAKATYLVLVVQNRCLDDCTGSLAVSLRFKVDTLIDLLQSSTNFNMGIDTRITFQDNWWSIGCDNTFPVKVSKTSFSSSGQIVPYAMSGCAPPVQDPKDAWNSAPEDYTLDGSLNTDGTAISEFVIHIHKKGPSIGYTREDTIDIKVTYVPVDLRGGGYTNSSTYIGYRDPFPLAKAAVELKGTMIWTISDGVDKGKVVQSNKIASWDATSASSGAVVGSFNRKVAP